MTMRLSYLIIGEICTDIFNYGTCSRLCPEAPVPVFTPTYRTENDGMAGNTYRNLQNLIGYSSSELDCIFSPLKSNKIRYVDDKSNHMFLRVDVGDENYGKFTMDSINKEKIRNATHIIISDYNKGFLDENDISDISCANPSATIYIDTKKEITEKIIQLVDFVKLNQNEFSKNSNNVAWNKLYTKYNNKFIVTLGERGTMWSYRTFSVENISHTIDVSGAGDTFMAAFCLQHSKTGAIVDSILFANNAASLVVTKRGVSTI